MERRVDFLRNLFARRYGKNTINTSRYCLYSFCILMYASSIHDNLGTCSFTVLRCGRVHGVHGEPVKTRYRAFSLLAFRWPRWLTGRRCRTGFERPSVAGLARRRLRFSVRCLRLSGGRHWAIRRTPKTERFILFTHRRNRIDPTIDTRRLSRNAVITRTHGCSHRVYTPYTPYTLKIFFFF